MKRPASVYGWFALPLLCWLVLLLVVPLAIVLTYAFLTRGAYGQVVWEPTLGNFARVADSLYWGIFLRSLLLATLTTAVCLVLGFPMAFTMAVARPPMRTLLFALVMVPFLTNFIVRVYAIRIILGVEGPLNALLVNVGLIAEPLLLTDTTLSVAVGMITNYLPFMVLPLYVVLEKFDFGLLEAASDLGARGRPMLWRILLPLTMPGMISGAVLVFIPVLGEFMIPDLLGGARTMLLGNLITEQFLKARDWPFGAVLTTVLVVMTAGAFALQRLVEARFEPQGRRLHG